MCCCWEEGIAEPVVTVPERKGQAGVLGRCLAGDALSAEDVRISRRPIAWQRVEETGLPKNNLNILCKRSLLACPNAAEAGPMVILSRENFGRAP